MGLHNTYMAIKNNNSPYSAALTGCSFMFYEFNRCLPLLMASNADELLKQEIEENRLLMVNSFVSRKRFIAEFQRRYNAVPRTFWLWYVNLPNEQAQRAAMFYVIMKTYRLVFDFHFNVARQKFFSITHEMTFYDVDMEFSEIASRDEFVNSWSDATRKKCISTYLTILRQVGMLNEKTNELSPLLLNDSDYEYYMRSGEHWFLEACLLQQYEIDNIKSSLL